MLMGKARDVATLALADREVPLRVRRHPKARSIILRIDDRDGGVTLVLPRRTSLSEGLRFAAGKQAWIARRLAALPPRTAFADGVAVPLLGVPHLIRHRPEGRGGVRQEGGEIHVFGRAEFLPRRLTDWLKAEAKREIQPRAREKAARINRQVERITVRELRSRWGSCSGTGRLSFCWRLILAPEAVLDYVVAHEVAHLAEMNHGPPFRRLLGELAAGGVKEAERWLRRHGPGLQRYG